jgi:hypothetical protein
VPEAKQKLRRRRVPQKPRSSAETDGGTGNGPETITRRAVAAAEEAGECNLVARRTQSPGIDESTPHFQSSRGDASGEKLNDAGILSKEPP